MVRGLVFNFDAQSNNRSVAIGAISDFLLAAYPIFLIRGLRLVSRATKLSLCLVMGGGFM